VSCYIVICLPVKESSTGLVHFHRHITMAISVLLLPICTLFFLGKCKYCCIFCVTAKVKIQNKATYIQSYGSYV
jgi:hypothetical protein